MRRLKWILVVPVAALVLAVGGTWAYVNVVRPDAPTRLTLQGTAAPDDGAAGADSAATAGLDGTWEVAGGSQAGYRVDEVLFGQHVTAVGRTSEVDGSMTLSGATVQSAAISIDLASVTTDENRRDNQFRTRIMNVAQYPTATFRLTKPITLDTLPADGATITVPATGDLTVRGMTRSATVNLTAKRSGSTIAVNGTIPVVFADYGIPSPSFGPASVEDHGEIEFLVNFTKA